MFDLKPLRNIKIVFSILGRNRLTLVHNRFGHLANILGKILKIVYFLILMISFVNPFKPATGYRTKLYISISTLFFNALIVNLVDIIDGWIYEKVLILTEKDIERSFDYLNNFIAIDPKISMFAQNFIKKIIISLIIFVTNLILRVTVPPDFFNDHAYILISIANFYKNIGILEAIFYIELQTMILTLLNDHLKTIQMDNVNQHSAPLNNDAVHHILNRIQKMYLNVWKISVNTNKRFGLFLVSVLVDATIMFFISITATYVVLQQNQEMAILRK